jgi:electron transfer flavoprotein alpha subunit
MKNECGSIWVYAGHFDKKINKSTLELLAKGRSLADKINVPLAAVLLGNRIKPLANELIRYGSDNVYLFEHKDLEHYTTQVYTQVMTYLIEKENPEIVLFSADTTGRDLAPRIAARLEVGLTADCSDLDIGDYENKASKKTYENILYQIRPAFGGDVMATIVTPEHRPQMATVCVGTFEPLKKNLNRSGKIIPFEVKLHNEENIPEILEIIREERETHLEDAKIIVSGGRGVGGPAGFNLLRDLADVLDAQVGATRAAVDAGWISYSHQIGQTGQIVKPDIYIACGISGAIQHIVGIKNAKKIIAINKDPNAPIFDIADYSIRGDLFELIPKLIEKLGRLNSCKNAVDVINEAIC